MRGSPLFGNSGTGSGIGALFTFSVKLSAERNAPDDAAGDEGIATAIPEEQDAADGALQPAEISTEKVNKAGIGTFTNFRFPALIRQLLRGSDQLQFALKF